MRWVKTQGVFSLAVVCLAAVRLLAIDTLSSGAFEGNDTATTPMPTLSNQSIERLIDMNSTYDSVKPSYSRSTVSDEADSPASPAEAAPAPANVQSKPSSNTAYIVGACCVIVGVGLGLCLLSLMSGRRRTIKRFTPQAVRTK